MKRFLLAVLLLLIATSAYAEGLTVETMVVGVGRSKKEALQDAFSLAAKQLNGTYVDVLVEAGHKEEPPVERKALSQYKIMNEKHENGLVYLAVSLLVEKQDTIVNAFSADFKSESVLDRDLTLARFAQASLKSSKQILEAMVDSENMISIGYQFKAIGQPKIEDVLADGIRGYIPVWIGRNSTFWLEYFDLMRRLEPAKGGINYGWYASLYEPDLRDSKGYTPLSFDIEFYRLTKDVGAVKVGSDIAEMLESKIATITIPGSTESIDVFFDRNLIIAGYNATSAIDTTIINPKDGNVVAWYLAPDWLDIADNTAVLSAPLGTPLYVAPDSITTKGLGVINGPLMQFFDIYGKTQKSEKRGKDLVTERRLLYGGWGEDMAVGTTGLGFIVKVPFFVKSTLDLNKGKDQLEIKVRSGSLLPGGQQADTDIIFEQRL